MTLTARPAPPPRSPGCLAAFSSPPAAFCPGGRHTARDRALREHRHRRRIPARPGTGERRPAHLGGARRGTSCHYLPADVPAIPDPALTRRSGAALGAAGLTCTTGPTVTTDAPTAPRPRRSASTGQPVPQGAEMEAAPCSPSAGPQSPGRLDRRDRRRARPCRPCLWHDATHAGRVLRGLFSSTTDVPTLLTMGTSHSGRH